MFTSGFGIVSECSRSLVPRPPQKRTTFIGFSMTVGLVIPAGLLSESLRLLDPQTVDQPVRRQIDVIVSDRLIPGDVVLQPAIK